jgi:SNF2 family DNA or RNA helicase
MTHQQIVRDYLNLYTPYRGLLLYHGLGSGKTCSSIAIAEGLKTSKPIIVMTPASLQVNYREELKKCGDELYRKNQFWEFVPTKGLESSEKESELADTLSNVLSISVDYINKNGGAWLINMTKPSNYDELPPGDKLKLDQQIDQMIMHKYQFINYNNPRLKAKIAELSKNNTINPFDNSVVIIDEAHNLVGRIVNKLGRKKESIAITLYTLLMKAKNVKIVLFFILLIHIHSA